MKGVFCVLFLTYIGAVYGVTNQCTSEFVNAGLSENYAETIAHAVHSLTLQDLKKWDNRTTVNNTVPTINRHLYGAGGINHGAPDVPLPDVFDTEEMQVVDLVLSHWGDQDDGLGEVWSTLERVVHIFHMRDLWHRIRAVDAPVVRAELCVCIMDTEHNGIDDKVNWIANEYKEWMPISLHEWGAKIPRLEDKNTWAEWKKRLTIYYADAAIHDAAIYLECALQ